MRYEKPWRSIDEQVNLLTETKGLECDQDELRRALVEIGYYRLSAYWFPYKVSDSLGGSRFREGTTLEDVVRSYEFDRRLRQLMFEAVGRIEVYLRSRISHLASMESGPFGYPEDAVPRLKREFTAAKKSEQFIKHFASKYGDEHGLPPYWMMMECVTMGTIELLYSKETPQVRTTIAGELGVRVRVLKNWISVLRVSRNACCHHSRVWNRTWGVKPMIPRAWEGFCGSNDRTFAVLSVLCHMLEHVGGAKEWAQQVDGLAAEFEDIPLEKVGFYDGWRESGPWSGLCCWQS